MMPVLSEPVRRKTLSIPVSMLTQIERYRKSQRIATEVEAIRRLLHEILTQHKQGKRDDYFK